MADFKTEIKDLKAGTGPEAKAGDTVTVHYTGTLADGTKFDEAARPQPTVLVHARAGAGHQRVGRRGGRHAGGWSA